jgi:GNAT superfamily N-acetyltransferase
MADILVRPDRGRAVSLAVAPRAPVEWRWCGVGVVCVWSPSFLCLSFTGWSVLRPASGLRVFGSLVRRDWSSGGVGRWTLDAGRCWAKADGMNRVVMGGCGGFIG